VTNGTAGLRGVNTKTQFSSGRAGFTSWHPSRNFIAFSMNRFEMLFYSAGAEPRAVFDAAADVAVFDLQKNTVASTPDLRQNNRIETMPEWAPDGRSLFFCSGPQLPETQYRDVRCDLMRIGFDPAACAWGKLDTVLTAQKAGGSVLQPRCSPDGRFVLVTVADYSDFPIDKTGARLCLYDLASSSLRRVWPANG
jgi:Tol biopolymer transport system component